MHINDKDKGRIVFTELHDAKIKSINILPDDKCNIELKHLAVYHQTAPQKGDVWSYRAEIVIWDIKQLNISGPLEKGEYIMDADLYDQENHELDELPYNRAIPMKMVRFQFFSGEEARFNDCIVELKLLEAVRKFEEWDENEN